MKHRLIVLQRFANYLDSKKCPKKRIWIKKWISKRGANAIPLYKEIEETDRKKFFQAFRMYPDAFGLLLSRFEWIF
jgi:hypothetical protein